MHRHITDGFQWNVCHGVLFKFVLAFDKLVSFYGHDVGYIRQSYWQCALAESDGFKTVYVLRIMSQHYKAGKTYRLTFVAQSSAAEYADAMESMEITFGNDRTIEAQTVLENGVIEDILGDPETYRFEVTPEADGVYYFGLHATTPARQGEFLMLSSLEIYDVENPPSGIEAVESGEGVKVFAGDGSVTVINPTGEQAMVYAMSGTLAAASADAYFAATLPAGAYVVKCGGTVVKVLVK